MDTATKILEFLAENGITQTFISKKTNIPVSKLNLALNGKRRIARNREADERRNLLQLLEPVIRKADPSVRSVVLINQGRLVQIDYANEFRRYVDIQGDSLLAIIYDVARVAMK